MVCHSPPFFENLHFKNLKPTNFGKRRTLPSRIRSFSAAAQRTFRACSRDEAAHAVACAAEASGARSIRTQRWRLPRLRPVHDSGRKPQPGDPGMRPPPHCVPFYECLKSWARLLPRSRASASALPSSCVSAAGSPPLLPMYHSHSTCAIQLRIWIDYPSIEDPPLVRADALQMLCSHSVTVRCKCTQSAVECEAMRGAWPVACAGRARFMRLGRLDLTPNLRAFWCRAPSCKSLAAAPSA